MVAPMDTGNPLKPPAPAPMRVDPTTGVASEAQPTATATMPASGIAPKLRAAFAAAAQARGQQSLGWNDPTSLLLWRIHYNLTPQQAQQAAYQVAAQNQTGQPFSDQDLDRIGFGARGGQNTQQQYDPAWGAGSAITNAVAQAGQTQNFSGPTDPNLLGYITQAAKTSAGVDLTPEQAQQLAQEGYDYHAASGQAVPTSYWDQEIGNMVQRHIPNPNQINPAVWDTLGPVGQGLALSAEQFKGWDPNEFLRQLNAQRPVGTARPATGVDYGGLGTGVM